MCVSFHEFQFVVWFVIYCVIFNRGVPELRISISGYPHEFSYTQCSWGFCKFYKKTFLLICYEIPLWNECLLKFENYVNIYDEKNRDWQQNLMQFPKHNLLLIDFKYQFIKLFLFSKQYGWLGKEVREVQIWVGCLSRILVTQMVKFLWNCFFIIIYFQVSLFESSYLKVSFINWQLHSL